MTREFIRYSLKPNESPMDAVSFLNDQGFGLYFDGYIGDELFVYGFKKGKMKAQVVSDETVEKCYIIIFNPDLPTLGELERIANSLRNPLRLNNSKDYIKLANDLKKPTDIYYAPMSSGPLYDEEIYNSYRAALENKDSDVRFYACTSAAYFIGAEWSNKIDPLLRDLVSREIDAEIKSAAERTLNSLTKRN